MALLGRDNSEDLNYSEESQPLTSPGAAEDDLNISHDDSVDITQAPTISHVVDIHEDQLRAYENQLRARERQRKEVFNDDVEKMFELPQKFDISSLISGSPAVVSEQQTSEQVSTTQGDTRLYREEDYTSGLSVEMSSMGHRRDSFPHIHHPLKALRSSRSSKSLRDDKPKKKKKKKKKRKMHTAKSFPSRSATLSPPIPEVEIEEYDISPPGSSSSSMSSDDFDNYRGEDDIDSPLLQVPTIHQPEGSPKGHHTPQPSSDDFKVGFYIGDRATSPVPEETTGKAVSPNKIFYVGDYADEPQLSPQDMHERRLSDFGVSYEEPKHSVKFSIGAEDSTAALKSVASNEGQGNGTAQPLHASSRSEPRIQKHRHKHHHHDPFKHEDLLLRRQIGSEVKMEDYLKHVPTETEEAILLQKADLDDMTSHRLENVRGIRRHKIAKHNAVASIVHIGKSDRGKKKPILKKKKIDHSPHEVFVELDELYLGENDYEWREKARWIKFEEDVEEGAERWGKPHVASLSFHSLLELRRGLESGCLLLDLDASDLPSIINSVIDTMIVHDQLRPENKGNVLRTLLLKHRHVGEGVKSLIRRNISYMNLKAMGLDNKNRHQGTKLSLMKSFSSASFGKSPSSTSIPMLERRDNKADKVNGKGGKIEAKDLQFVKVDVDNNMQTDGVHIGITTPESTQRNIRDITRRIPKGAEAITVLVGSVDYLDTPTMAFVRLAEGQILENLTEVPLPVRFLFILLGPETTSMDYHEVGRSISTLMSNQDFHDVAYRAESRGEILHAINQFLDESIVLPPGDWDQKTLLPIAEMNKKRARLRKRKKQKEEEKKALLKKVEEEKIPSDPLKRTGCIFGGLINDVRRRYPYYISDFTDALNGQCVAAFVFIFFACFAPCIAFGGLLEEKTGGYIGVTETVVSTSLCGIIFGLFAGQPLMIVGATGPVLVFEQSLYKFCKSNSIEFLTMRVWIGFWVMMISAIVVALESSFLVRYITRFTEEIFAILISLIFIFEVIKKLDKTFQYHPLVPLENYCKDFGCKANNGSNLYNSSVYLYTNTSNANLSSDLVYSHPNNSDHYDDEDDEGHHKYKLPQPNTALMSSILTIGTFLVAHFLKIFRNSKFLGRSARRALGDFGIVISIILMVLLDYSMPDIYTQKLSISNTFEPTSPNKRGWFVHPLGTKKPIQAYIIFASFIPAFLIFILLFLETQITEMILNKKEFKMRKGSGFHLDQVLMGVMTFVCALFGLPWMCAATVRTIAHTSALSVMSRTHAPGEKPKLVEVKEQRVTNILMNAMIGVSLTWGPLLQAIPLAVLFGVFLYLGVSSLGGVQMFKRMKLLFVPNKYHPSISYVRRVKTIRMHLFTVVQVILLVLLLIVKLSVAALAFPLFVILLIPLRLKLLGYVFTPNELQVLDKEEEDSDYEDEDDPDFYQQAHMPV